MRIAVAGTGYVGLLLAVLLAQHNHVDAVDVVPAKVEKLANWESPIADAEIERFLVEAAQGERALDLHPTLGALGGCMSICVVYCLRTAGLNVIYKVRLGINLGCFFRDTYARWVPPAAVTALAGLVADAVSLLALWPAVVSEVALMALLYAALLWAFTLNGYEKGLIG